MRQVQIADEGPHQAGLAHARGQSKTERGELAFEIGHRRELAANGGQGRVSIGILLRRRNLRDAVQYLQRPALRCTQAESAGDGVDVSVHGFFVFLCDRRAGLGGGSRRTSRRISSRNSSSLGRYSLYRLAKLFRDWSDPSV